LYVQNKGKSTASPLIPELQLVSDLIFEKGKASCFSNNSLYTILKNN